MKGRKWISSLIIISMLFVFPSCSHRDEAPEDAGYGYSCQFFDVPEKLGYKVYQTSILMDGEDYCIASAYRKTDVKSDDSTTTFVQYEIYDPEYYNKLELYAYFRVWDNIERK
mgnify:CR=1 FL=1